MLNENELRKVWKLTILRVRVKRTATAESSSDLPRFDSTHEERHPGALARTDVFEMVLRKPQNGEYCQITQRRGGLSP